MSETQKASLSHALRADYTWVSQKQLPISLTSRFRLGASGCGERGRDTAEDLWERGTPFSHVFQLSCYKGRKFASPSWRWIFFAQLLFFLCLGGCRSAPEPILTETGEIPKGQSVIFGDCTVLPAPMVSGGLTVVDKTTGVEVLTIPIRDWINSWQGCLRPASTHSLIIQFTNRGQASLPATVTLNQ